MSDQSDWISVGELSEAFSHDSNAPESTSILVGEEMRLWLEDGQVIDCRFESGDRLVWGIGSEGSPGPAQESTCRVVPLREGLFFVDFVWTDARATTVTLLLDLARGMATVLVGTLPTEEESRRGLLDRISSGDELTGVDASFLSAAVGRPWTEDTPRHRATADLVGRRVEYTYSPRERYEHIYLNESFYTWHCLDGVEAGLADTDRCHYFELADQLYLFVWREKIVPTLGVVVVDFDRMKTAGKILGYRGDGSGVVENFPVGAVARLLNVTTRS